MSGISKDIILSKTHYGLTIYSHILQLYYPDEVVLRLVERDCGLCRNPFNSDKETLHIWIEKTDPTNATSNELSCKREQNSTDDKPSAIELARIAEVRKRKPEANSFEVMPSAADNARSEFACHQDTSNTIPAGNAFDFAELHYKQQGNELLQTLNKELFLRIGEERNFYRSAQKNTNCSHTSQSKSPQKTDFPLSFSFGESTQRGIEVGETGGALFSFFKAPIINTKPHKAVNLLQTYNAIKGNYYKDRTQKLRAISDIAQARKYKAANFDYCTFSGTFTTRNDKALIKHSGLLCIDFDHLQNLQDLKSRLLTDEYFDTQLLFVSPSGDGLKWIIPIDTAQTTHNDYFKAVSSYVQHAYGVEIDKSGRDVSRACFLPYDPQAYINPVYLQQP